MSVTSGSNDLNSVVESDYASSNIVVNGASMISPADEVMPPIVSVATVISSGETMSGIALLPGGELSVLSGGITSSILIDGGTQSILSGGIDTNVLIDNGQQYVIGGVVTSAWLSVAVNVLQPGSTVIGNSVFQYATNTAIQYVSAGGVVDGVTIWESVGGWMDGGQTLITLGEAKQYVLDGGTVANAIVSAGTQYISSGGVVNHVMLSGYMGHYFSYPATQYVYDGGVTNNTFLASTAQQYVYSGGGATSTTIYSLGSSFVDVGGVTSDVTINGGYLQLDGTVSGSMIIRNGGYASIGSDGKIEGNVILSAGGSMTIGMSNGGTIDLVGDQNKGLVISGYVAGQNDSMTTVISGLTADSNKQVTVDGLQGANVSSVAYPDDNHITLQLLDGTSLTLNIVGIKESGYTLGSDASGDLTMIVCFLSGTLIKMAKGVCAVEDLQVGDTILTYDPQSKAKVKKKITWVGKQTAHVNAKLPDDQAGYPVRILKDAFKKNVPNKDLLITSEHCLFIDGHFVPARMLVNGRSIFYDYSITSYDYYHVETEDHSVIWADGMLTESYLNTGNRHSFNKDQKVVQLDPHVKIWAEDAVAPLTVERNFVEPIFNDLVKRADKQKLVNQNESNFVLSNDPELYLLTEDGEEIYQSRVDKDRVIFSLPANTQHVYLVSRKSRPCDVIGPFVDDRRPLGVLIGRVVVLNQYGAYPVAQYLQQDELQGWSVIEDKSCRWTMGCAFLPLEVYNAEHPFEIAIQIIQAGPYLVEEESLDEEKIAV